MKNTPDSRELIAQLKNLLLKGNAHPPIEDVLKNIPAKMRGIAADGLPYSIWQLVEHIRIDIWDILDFSSNAKYKPMKWPADYWPKEKAPKDATAWNNSIKEIKKNTKEFTALLEKKDADLYTPFPWGQGQNLLREALVIADHSSYHIGQIVVIRRLLGIWK